MLLTYIKINKKRKKTEEYRTVDQKELEERRRVIKLEKKLKIFLVEITVFTIFVFVLYTVAFNSINVNNYRYKQSLENVFSKANNPSNFGMDEVCIQSIFLIQFNALY